MHSHETHCSLHPKTNDKECLRAAVRQQVLTRGVDRSNMVDRAGPATNSAASSSLKVTVAEVLNVRVALLQS
jgi:hypothetical protein